MPTTAAHKQMKELFCHKDAKTLSNIFFATSCLCGSIELHSEEVCDATEVSLIFKSRAHKK
jgi:hypothetical protein